MNELRPSLICSQEPPKILLLEYKFFLLLGPSSLVSNLKPPDFYLDFFLLSPHRKLSPSPPKDLFLNNNPDFFTNKSNYFSLSPPIIAHVENNCSMSIL